MRSCTRYEWTLQQHSSLGTQEGKISQTCWCIVMDRVIYCTCTYQHKVSSMVSHTYTHLHTHTHTQTHTHTSMHTRTHTHTHTHKHTHTQAHTHAHTHTHTHTHTNTHTHTSTHTRTCTYVHVMSTQEHRASLLEHYIVCTLSTLGQNKVSSVQPNPPTSSLPCMRIRQCHIYTV